MDSQSRICAPFPDRKSEFPEFSQAAMMAKTATMPGFLQRPSAFLHNSSLIGASSEGRQEPIYGYAIIQKPCLVPINSTSVYMSCYTTINNGSVSNENAHYYVNGDFLAEKLRMEDFEVIVHCD